MFVYLVHYFYMYYYISPIHIFKIVFLQVLFKCEVDKFVSLLVPRDVKATNKAMNHMYQIERHLVENFKKTNKKLVELENAVFSAAALLTNGLGHILLVVAIKFDGQMIYRFIESGRYVGVMHFHKLMASIVCILQRMLSCIQETNHTVRYFKFY